MISDELRAQLQNPDTFETAISILNDDYSKHTAQVSDLTERITSLQKANNDLLLRLPNPHIETKKESEPEILHPMDDITVDDLVSTLEIKGVDN